MGTDINLAVEVYDSSLGMWELAWDQRSFFDTAEALYITDVRKKIAGITFGWLFDHPFVLGRNYDLFYRLAGVRGGIYCEDGPLFRLRGMPINASDETKQWFADEEKDSGIHSLTYLYLSELLSVPWSRTEPCDCCDGETPVYAKFWKETLPALRRLADSPDDVRIIIFFDS